MRGKVPFLAVVLGFLGLIPFAGTALASITAVDPAQAGRMLAALAAYGAVILSFTGAVHWGLALHPIVHDAGVPRAERERLLLGVVPALIGWVALLTGIMFSNWLALAILTAGFAGTMGVEHRAWKLALLPPGYVWLRWLLTIAIVVILGAVLLLHLFGIHNTIPVNAG